MPSKLSVKANPRKTSPEQKTVLIWKVADIGGDPISMWVVTVKKENLSEIRAYKTKEEALLLGDDALWVIKEKDLIRVWTEPAPSGLSGIWRGARTIKISSTDGIREIGSRDATRRATLISVRHNIPQGPNR